MRSNQSVNRFRTARRASVLAAAITCVAPALALAQSATNDPGAVGTGVEFVISTSGATALGSFTQARNTTTNVYVRGPFAMGANDLRIGQTVYSRGTGQFFGIADKTSALGNEPALTNDRVAYKFHSTGSAAGILEMLRSQNLMTSGNTAPIDPTTANPLFINGNRFTAVNTGPVGGYSTGNNQGNGIGGQETVRIAWSDVRSEQAFARTGSTAAFNKKPTEVGYGLGRGNVGATNFQALASDSSVSGGIFNASTTRVRNETVAVVPFNLVASPGTGLARVSKDEGAFLQAVGRLPNGANFNSSTRDIGSGTRNQGANNLGIDPTWASGERDRISLSATSYTQDGQTVNLGDEAAPTRSLRTGSTTTDLNESRVSPTHRFADKTSGSTGIRASVTSSRMALGILSASDTGSRATSIGAPTVTDPLRALAIDWGNGSGNVQATAANVTSGAYQMWSNAQAVTVMPVGHTVAMDTADNNGRPINGDQDDESAVAGPLKTPLGIPTGPAIGIHRKFIDNITASVGSGTSSETNQTPVDSLIFNGFMPPQIMGVSKSFDGGTQSARTRSNVDPDGAGPLVSEQQLYNDVATGAGTLATVLNWADPSNVNGNLGGGGVRYNVYSASSVLTSSNANADISITVKGRTNLAGDLNNDGVRDLADTAGFALAYADSAAYLLANGAATTSADSTVNDGSSLNSTVRAFGGGVLLGNTLTAGQAGLLVLTDLNSDGNVNAAGTNVDAVSRADVQYFLYGATVDTTGFGATTTTLNGATVSLTAAQNRRENGIRLGELKKNTAIATFNTTIDGIAALTPAQKADLKFEKRDVNLDGSSSFDNETAPQFNYLVDALALDSVVGRNYTNLLDVVSSNVDLVSANLTDDANPVIGQADMSVMNEALTTTAGVNSAGRVDHTWAASTTKSGASDIVLNAATGTFVVPASSSLTINGGSLSVGGVADPFTQGANHVNVVVNTTGAYGLKVTAGVKSIGSLTGTGNTQITGGTLVAQSVVLNGTTVAPTSKIDIGANFLVVDNNTQLADVKNYVKAGRGTANANGVYDYVGQGITSAAIGTANGTAGFNKYAIGYLLNSDLAAAGTTLGIAGLTGYSTFGGATVDSSAILVRYTYNGDANLDGIISSLDYALLNAGFAGTLSPSLGWLAGDFTLDGVVNADDYAVLDFAALTWGNTPLGTGDPISVPEPTSIAALALATAGLLGRRRRNIARNA